MDHPVVEWGIPSFAVAWLVMGENTSARRGKQSTVVVEETMKLSMGGEL
jgi:hypothetical protein